MRFTHLYLLSLGAKMLQASFSPSWYPGGNRNIEDMSNRDVLEGTMNLMQDTFCRNCLDFCVNPETAERQLREEDVQFIKAYAIWRLVRAFKSRTQRGCITQCTRALQVLLNKGMPGFAVHVLETNSYPADDARIDTMAHWVQEGLKQIPNYRCTVNFQRVPIKNPAPDPAPKPDRPADPIDLFGKNNPGSKHKKNKNSNDSKNGGGTNGDASNGNGNGKPKGFSFSLANPGFESKSGEAGTANIVEKVVETGKDTLQSLQQQWQEMTKDKAIDDDKRRSGLGPGSGSPRRGLLRGRGGISGAPLFSGARVFKV